MSKGIKAILAVVFASTVLANGVFADNNPIRVFNSTINISRGLNIIDIYHSNPDFDPYQTLPSDSLTYPSVPLAGFTPFIAIMASDKRVAASEIDSLSYLETGYTGNPLATSPNYPNTPWVIGLLDSGTSSDIVFGSAATTLGIVGGSVSATSEALHFYGTGPISANISQPLAVYAAGLGAVNPDNSITPTKIVGQSNKTIYVAEPITFQSNETMTAVLGKSFMAFYTTVIRNDKKYAVTLNGKSWYAPDIQFLPQNATNIPEYSYEIPVSFESGSPALNINSAAYFSSSSESPASTTYLAYNPQTPNTAIPIDGYFLIELTVTENNITKTLNMQVETGTQTTILSTDAAQSLGLSQNQEFTVDIYGFNQTISNIPGYYLDTVSIATTTAPLNFSNVPVITTTLDLQGIDGILGMNFFYNRNITFAPTTSNNGQSCKIYVSDPIDHIFTDFDHNGKTDLIDFAALATAWNGQAPETQFNIAYDLKNDFIIDLSDLELFADRWLNNSPD